MKYELGEEVDDPFAAQSPASSKSKYTLGEESDDPFGEAPKKTRGFTGALKRGTEEALLNAGALISEVGKQTGYGGKVAPKALAKLAGLLHDPNYVSGAEDIMAPGASWGDRAAGVGRALVEGAPTLALGALGGAPGMAAAAGTMGAGSGIRRVREADQVSPDAPLDAGQLGRVGASAAIDAAGTLIPAGRALAPIKSAGGSSLPMALAKAGITGVKDAVEAAGVSAASSIAQAAAQKPLLEGQFASPEELMAAGAIGGAAAGGTRAFRMLPQMNEELSQQRFNAVDPVARARAANLLNDLTGNYKTLREGISEDVRGLARKQATADLDKIASAGKIDGPNLIKDRLNALVDEGNTVPSSAYTDAITAVKAGEPVSPKYIAPLKEALAGDPLGDAWLQQLDVASAIGELGNMGKASGTSRVGGLRSTRLGEQLDRLSGYFGLGTVGSGIVGAVTGHPIATVGAGIGAGANLMNAAVRGIDTFTGQSNPVGRFARRYADPSVDPVTVPTPTSADARMALRVSKLAQSYDAARAREAAKAQKTQEKTMATDARLALKTAKLKQQFEADRLKAEAKQRDEQLANAKRTLDLMQRSESASATDAGLALKTAKLAKDLEQSRVQTEAKQRDEQLANAKRTLDLMQRSESASASDAGLALRSAKLAQGFDQARARQELAASKAQEQAFQGQLRDDRYRLSLMTNSEGASATDARLPLSVARLKSSLAASGERPPSAPAEAISNIVNNRPPNDSAPGPSNSVPPPVEPLVGQVRPPMTEAIAPKPMELEASVTPMEEAIKQEAPKAKAKATKSEPGVDKVTGVFNGVEISIPKKDIRVSQAAWERSMNKAASARKTFTDLIKDSLGAEDGEAFDKLSGNWMNDKTLTNARQRLIKFLDEQKIEGKERKAILDEFESDEELKKTWKSE